MQVLTKQVVSQEWCHTFVIPAFRKLGQKDHQFKSSLGYIVEFRPGGATQQDLCQKQSQGIKQWVGGVTRDVEITQPDTCCAKAKNILHMVWRTRIKQELIHKHALKSMIKRRPRGPEPSVILVLGKWKQEDWELNVILGYIGSPSQHVSQNNKNK